MTESSMVTMEEASAMLRVGLYTIRKLIRTGSLSARRYGYRTVRIPRELVLRHIKTTPPVKPSKQVV